MRSKILLVIAALTMALVIAPATFASNLVNNGSFETGDFTGWNVTGLEEVVTGPFYVYTGAEDGNWYSVWGNVGSNSGISQTITTTPGQHYTFSFWFNAVGDDPSDFSASWDGTALYSANNPNTGGVWTQFSFDVVGTGSDTLSFSGRDDPAWMALDNISVTPAGGLVPEPSSLLLMGTSLLGLGGVIRRKLGR